MSSLLQRHAAHTIMLGGPLLLLGGMLLALHLTRPDRVRPPLLVPTYPWLLVTVVVCWVGAAAVHISVIRSHFHEALALGLFFVGIGAVQIGYAAALWHRPTRVLLGLGLAANCSIVTLWLYTRLVAVPFGLGAREPVGVADVTATCLELLGILAAGLLLRPASVRRLVAPAGTVGSLR